LGQGTETLLLQSRADRPGLTKVTVSLIAIEIGFPPEGLSRMHSLYAFQMLVELTAQVKFEISPVKHAKGATVAITA
jgi:hypothetical protein